MKSISLLSQHWTDIYYNLRYTYEEKIPHQAICNMQIIDKNKYMNVVALAQELQTASNTASEYIKRLVEKSISKNSGARWVNESWYFN